MIMRQKRRILMEVSAVQPSDREEKFKFYFDKWVFGFTILMNFLFHGYLFTHSFLNQDNVRCFFVSNCNSGIQSGRWFLPVINRLVGDVSNSWIQGIAGGIFLGLTAVVIVNIFCIQNRNIAYLLAATLVAFPSNASIYSYMFTSSQYLFSVFLASSASYFIVRKKTICGAILLAFSMGIYQAFITVSISLLFYSLLLDILNKRIFGIRSILCVAFRYVASLGLALVIYTLILKLALWIQGVALLEYQGIGSFSFSVVFSNISNLYRSFFGFFKYRLDLRTHFYLLVYLSSALSLIFIGMIVYRNKLYRSISVFMILLLIIVLIPLGLNAIALLHSDATYIHDIMVYSMVFQLLLPLLLIENTGLLQEKDGVCFISSARRTLPRRFLLIVLLSVQIMIPYEMVLSNNNTYACMELTYRNAVSYFTRVFSRIEQHEDFDPNIRIALIGKVRFENNMPKKTLTGALVGEEAFNMYSRYVFYMNDLGVMYRWVNPNDFRTIAVLPEFKEMPCYPHKGSIKRIGDCLVVKFSDYE